MLLRVVDGCWRRQGGQLRVQDLVWRDVAAGQPAAVDMGHYSSPISTQTQMYINIRYIVLRLLFIESACTRVPTVPTISHQTDAIIEKLL